MATITQNQSDKLTLLEASLGIQQEHELLGDGVVNPALCAALKREELLQYNFMFIYQALVLILALIVLALLVFAAWRIVTVEETFQAIIAGAGALVSGTAATFLLKQRQDARDAHEAAKEGLKKHSCP